MFGNGRSLLGLYLLGNKNAKPSPAYGTKPAFAKVARLVSLTVYPHDITTHRSRITRESYLGSIRSLAPRARLARASRLARARTGRVRHAAENVRRVTVRRERRLGHRERRRALRSMKPHAARSSVSRWMMSRASRPRRVARASLRALARQFARQ